MKNRWGWRGLDLLSDVINEISDDFNGSLGIGPIWFLVKDGEVLVGMDGFVTKDSCDRAITELKQQHLSITMSRLSKTET